jgi:arginine N-succinyltransferase
MLSEAALAVLGKPHPSGAGAMRMLEAEGFSAEGYVDIFDGGPTMSAPTDKVRTIAEARELILAGTHDGPEGTKMLLAAGRLADFAAAHGRVEMSPQAGVTVDAASAALLGLEPGDPFLAVER